MKKRKILSNKNGGSTIILLKIIKKLIKAIFKSFGLKLLKYSSFISEIEKIDKYFQNSIYYYEYYLKNYEKLDSAEILQYLEMKYGGPIFHKSNLNFGGTSGGDRFNVFFHNYSKKYSEYLNSLRYSKKQINILEIGILKGTGLAVWDEYFDNKKIYGFDYDLINFEQHKINLIELGAFQNELPILKFYDQFADNSEMLNEIFCEVKIDVVIDDAYHSDQSIINTFNELQPYLSSSFIYFIEDNRTAWKKLQMKYPNYIFDYNDDELTVVIKSD